MVKNKLLTLFGETFPQISSGLDKSKLIYTVLDGGTYTPECEYV
jgi:hypothetical protein